MFQNIMSFIFEISRSSPQLDGVEDDALVEKVANHSI